MSGTRVYLPSTLSRLADVLASGAVGPAPLRGHAVTEALRTAWPDGGEEEWEYAALSSAAQDSVGLLTATDQPRRVVVVVDGVRAVPVEADDDPTLVEVREVVAAHTIAAVHSDSGRAEADVAAARDAWADAAAGDATASVVVERCLEHELGWFASQEIDDLLGA
ncbi:MAG TPA: hypothetical protein VJ819_02430 [Nocardioidaceae bacterium]|jgi:hypothetical protein|nr:hypothetical protein [Nocardioidaceae bacterium]